MAGQLASLDMGVLNMTLISVGIISALLLIIFCGIWFLYKSTYPSVDDINESDRTLVEMLFSKEGDHNAPRAVEAFHRERFGAVRYIFDVQESFWASFLQATISLFVIGFIVILLLLKIVEAQAGLPIIAAIGGAALGRGGPPSRAQVRSVERKDT